MSEPHAGPSGAAAGGCLCRRSTAAPVTAWGTFRRTALDVTGDPRDYRSSTQGVRSFCPDCGTQILFPGDRTPERVDVNLATRDDPALVRPQYHVWTDARIPSFDTADRLPRHPGAGPDAAAS